LRIVVAPNALKGSLSASEAAEAIAQGARRALGSEGALQVLLAPVSDGGDGLVDVLDRVLDAERRRSRVAGPLGPPVDAEWLLSRDGATAVIEMAAASGIALLTHDELDPMRASTRGTGELVREAVRAGARRVLVGLGGSATVDGGTGAARALGVRFLDDEDGELEPCGAALARICGIDASGLDPEIASGPVRVEALFDAANPLLGPAGAARVYAPQKGASPDDVETLEAGMRNLAAVIERDLGADVRDLPGAGAAGGLGAGLAAFIGADLRPGAEVVFELIGLEEKMRGADLAITAEGELDAQSAFGKAPAEVARLAKRLGTPCVALAGRVSASDEELRRLGITRAYAIRPEGMPLAESMRRARELLGSAAERATRDSVSS
jgi:glycerate kinase